MSLYITSLNSGSNGNCYYIGNDCEAILVDAGLSCRETEKRMQSLGLLMSRVKAVFVSHEHCDHIKGLQAISEKYQLPVFITSATLRYCGTGIKKQLVKELRAYHPVHIGSLAVTAFPKHHDAGDPHSFMISCEGINVGVFTDIGAACLNVTDHFSQCHAAFLEANYDEDMLEDGRYPIFLKNRIRGGKGHLSNRQALEIFTKHRPSFMTHLLLSHISKENNCPERVKQMFDAHAAGIKIIVASRYGHTALFTIQKTPEHAVHRKRLLTVFPMKQLSLFD